MSPNTLFILSLLENKELHADPLTGQAYRFLKDGTRKNYYTEKSRRGYMRFRVQRDGVKKWIFMHKIVWMYHNGIVPQGLVIDHIDRNKKNNKLENLRLLTPSENAMNTDRYAEAAF